MASPKRMCFDLARVRDSIEEVVADMKKRVEQRERMEGNKFVNVLVFSRARSYDAFFSRRMFPLFSTNGKCESLSLNV